MLIVLGGEPSATDWMTAIAAGLTFFVALVALIFAWGQIKEAEKTRMQTAKIEREKSQPMVVAYMEMGPSNQFMELVIKNFGQTPAYYVRCTSDIKIERVDIRNNDTVLEVLLPSEIPYMAPDQEWRTLWDVPYMRIEENGTLPDRHEITTTYEGIGGDKQQTKAVLDWNIYRDVRTTDNYGIHQLTEALRTQNEFLSKWTDHNAGSGLKVWARDGDARVERERLEYEEQMKRIKAQKQKKQDSSID